MFDIGPTELLLVAFVAIVVIGPKDLPKAMRLVGYWVGRARGVSRQFRSGFDAMVREAELKELESRWDEENKRIMAEHPTSENEMLPILGSDDTSAVAKSGPEPEAAADQADDPPPPETKPVKKAAARKPAVKKVSAPKAPAPKASSDDGPAKKAPAKKPAAKKAAAIPKPAEDAAPVTVEKPRVRPAKLAARDKNKAAS